MSKIPNFVLIRGLARNNHHWGDFVDQLQEDYPKSKIILLELPGNGNKYNQKSPLNIAHYLTQLRAEWVSQKESTDECRPWIMIAISLGAMIAMQWASKFNDFDKIYLINTSSSDVANPLKRFSLKAIIALPQLFLSNNISQREKTILGLTLKLTPIDEKLITKWSAIANQYPLSKMNFLRQLYAAAHFRSPRQIQTPLEFMTSVHDDLVDYHCSQKLAKKYNSKISIHQKAGHDIPLDDSKWLLRIINQK